MIILLYPAAYIYSSILFSFFKFKKKEKKREKEFAVIHFHTSRIRKTNGFIQFWRKKKKNRSPDINERNQKYSSVKWPRNIPFVPPIGNNFHPSILKAREMWKALPRICQSHDKLLVDIIATDCFQQRDTNFHATSCEWMKEEEEKKNKREEEGSGANGNGLRVKR